MAISKEKYSSNQFIIEALNNLTKAHGAQIRELQAYKEENDRRLEKIESQLERHEYIIEPLYKDYIRRLIKEVAKHYNKKQNEVTYDMVNTYREVVSRSHDITIKEIRNRLWRIYYLKDVRIGYDYFQELYSIIGKTEDQIREELHAIAQRFKKGHKGSKTIYTALNLNAEYIEKAVELIFKYENKYGINDQNKEYVTDIFKQIDSPYTINLSEASNNEYIKWSEDMLSKFAKLCKTDEDEANSIFFKYYQKVNNRHKQENENDKFGFTNNFINNMNIVLNNDKLRHNFPYCISHNLVNGWNRRVLYTIPQYYQREMK